MTAVTWWRLRRRALRPLLLSAAGLAVFALVLEVIKAAIGRADPGSGSDRVLAGGAAFPSGHTSGATVVCGLAVWLAVLAARQAPARQVSGQPRGSRYACLIAGGAAGLAAGAAMVRMGYHWVSDVAGGWLLGTITLLAVLAAAAALAHRPAITEGADLTVGEASRGEDGVGVRTRPPGR